LKRTAILQYLFCYQEIINIKEKLCSMYISFSTIQFTTPRMSVFTCHCVSVLYFLLFSVGFIYVLWLVFLLSSSYPLLFNVHRIWRWQLLCPVSSCDKTAALCQAATKHVVSASWTCFVAAWHGAVALPCVKLRQNTFKKQTLNATQIMETGGKFMKHACLHLVQ
jgi:hypothetical protein